METITWSDEDTANALRFWHEYQETHDLSDCHGQVAGIDPATGRVWLAASAKEIAGQLKSEGIATPLYFIRVGYDYHVRKGLRR